MEAAVNWVHLPNEILEIIFSYCTHSDLVQSIQNVCCRWREVAQSTRVWRGVTYCTHSDLVQSIQNVCCRWREVAQSTRVWKDVTYCPDPSTRYEQVVEMLEISPKLQNIILRCNYNDRVLQTLTENCADLKKLQISKFPGIDMNFIKNLQEKCPKIEYLKIPHPVLTDKNKCEVDGKFTNLKILHLTGDPARKRSTILKPVADHCKKLEHLELETCRFEMNDLHYLLSMRKDTLHTLRVCCINLSGKCVLPVLSACDLKSLSLFRYCDHPKIEHFQQLKTVRALSITTFYFEDDFKQIFENEYMAQLVELSLEHSVDFDNDVAEVIVRNCPRLKKLSLKRLFKMTDASLKIITNLKELNSLTISHNDLVTDMGIFDLQGLKSLKRLTITSCKLGLGNISKLRTLQALTLQDQSLAEFPWDLIPHDMQYLQCLRIHYCRNVNTGAVETLKTNRPSLRVEVLK